jgi:hypothetical protein
MEDSYLFNGGSFASVPRGKRLRRYTMVAHPEFRFLVGYRTTAHGLVADEVQGLGEPSLLLTLPRKPSETDDGCSPPARWRF